MRMPALFFASMIVIAMAFSVDVIRADEPINIGSRRELFVDHALISRLDGRAELKLHQPTRREIAITFDQPWEGNASGYPTVFADGGIYRMYYRGHRYLIDKPPLRQAQSEAVWGETALTAATAEKRPGSTLTVPYHASLGPLTFPPNTESITAAAFS